MSQPANPYDNASCESFVKTLKREEIDANTYRDLDHLRTHLEAFIERYYNRYRLHSALGYRPPEEFERTMASANTLGGATLRFLGTRSSLEPMQGGSEEKNPLTNKCAHSKLSQPRGSPTASHSPHGSFFLSKS
jgi:integrase-like protein